MEKIKNFLTRRRLWFAWLAILVVCALALAWVRYDLAETVDGQPVYEIVNDDYSRMIEIPASSGTGAGGLSQTMELSAGQTLYGVRLNMATYNYAFATGTLHAELCSGAGEILTVGTLPCIELRDNTFETVIFDTPYTAAAAETLTLHLWADGFNETEQSRPLGIWASEAQVGAMTLSDGEESLDATAAIQYVVDYSGNWSGKILLVPAVLIFAAVAVGFWLLFGRKARPALAVLVCGGLLGAAFAVVTPPLVAPDEYTHLAVAYQYAGSLLGQPVTSEDGTLLVRACDEPYFGSQTGDIGIFAYKTMGENLTAPGGGIPDTKTDISVDLTGRIWYLYLGQTAGIALARALGLSFFAMLLLGRLGNLFLYLVLAALGVRLAAPNQRGLFAAVALLPMSLQLAGSLSADALVLGMAFSYTALCFALRQQPARPAQLAALLILAACIGPAKAIYLPVVLLCLIIPAKYLVWREKDREQVLCLGGAQGIRVRPGTLTKVLALVLAVLFWLQANLGALLYATRDVDNVGLTPWRRCPGNSRCPAGDRILERKAAPPCKACLFRRAGALRGGRCAGGALPPDPYVGRAYPGAAGRQHPGKRRFHLHLLGGIYPAATSRLPSSCCCARWRSRGRSGCRASSARCWANPSSTASKSAGCWAWDCWRHWLRRRCPSPTMKTPALLRVPACGPG